MHIGICELIIDMMRPSLWWRHYDWQLSWVCVFSVCLELEVSVKLIGSSCIGSDSEDGRVSLIAVYSSPHSALKTHTLLFDFYAF